ncbi:hypothetical protein ACE103_39165 [Bradyrhizobium sp. ma5]|uniref:hypothetical protein n=1 Tax=Bradyrhizobium sp. ma5 TaxID=3344828 RepID=UPI0035D5132E
MWKGRIKIRPFFLRAIDEVTASPCGKSISGRSLTYNFQQFVVFRVAAPSPCRERDGRGAATSLEGQSDRGDSYCAARYRSGQTEFLGGLALADQVHRAFREK